MAPWLSNKQRSRDLAALSADGDDDYEPTRWYREQRASNALIRCARRWLAKRRVQKLRVQAIARKRLEQDVQFMDPRLARAMHSMI